MVCKDISIISFLLTVHCSVRVLTAEYLYKQVDSVSFNVWDVGGPASMSTVNQCFFTDKALYVVVWNLALGEEAVANLQSWLLNIEVRNSWYGIKHNGGML